MAGPAPKLVVLFTSAVDVEAVVRGASAAAGATPLIGCTTAGELTIEGVGDGKVIAFCLGGDGFSIATRSAVSGSPEGLRAAAAEAAGCLAEVEERPHNVLLLLADGLAGDQRDVVRGAYDVVGSGTRLVGGCAGDGLRMEGTRQFHGERVHTGAVVAAAIASDGPLGIGVRHGWGRVGESMLVTASVGTKVLAIDERPALDVYLECTGAPREARSDLGVFTRFAMTHPLGLARRASQEVRFVAGADFDERALVCVAEVPEGSVIWTMTGDDASVLTATEAACADAVSSLGGVAPIGALAFDCIARRGVLGDHGTGTEVDRIRSGMDGAPVAGFYTYGEIARVTGLTGFHNQTLVVLGFG